jgi:hypothetical protein
MCADAERRHDPEALPALLPAEGVVGVSRLSISLAFFGKIVCTLVYTADAVRIAVADASTVGPGPFLGTVTKPCLAMRPFGPLASWERLRAAAFAAPSCFTSTEDGVSYRHAALDWQGGIETCWSNPDWFAHRQQCELAEAYRSLIESSGLLLEQGSRVRIRTGLMAGLVGRVERLDRYKGRLRVVAELGGQGAALDLTVSDIEPEPPA